MIDKSSVVISMDTKLKGYRTRGSIEELYYNYINRLEKIEVKVDLFNVQYESVNLTNTELYIQDMTGYTRVDRIIKVPNTHKWISIKSKHGDIVLTDDTVLPIYSDDTHIGFHGEVKRDYQLKPIHDINSDDYSKFNKIRFYDEYDKVEQLADLEYTYCDNISPYGYIIITNTGFFNVQSLYIYAGKDVGDI